MRKIKYIIPIVLLFMVIGFAAVTTSLSINADMELLGDLDNFAIYYSRAVVNGEEDYSIIVSSTELDFGAALKEVGTPYVIEYDITNASPSFDAEIEMTCSGSTEYFEISNVFDTSTPLEARQTRTGTLTLTKIKTLAGDAINSTVSCTIVATPIERNSESSSAIPTPLENPIYVGREIAIGNEKFNIITDNGDTVTLLAQYNIDTTTYSQTTNQQLVSFSNSGGWSNTPPSYLEIDVQTYGGVSKTVLNNYISYLKKITGFSDITGAFVSRSQLQRLGCVFSSDYYTSSTASCNASSYAEWLSNGQVWWTQQAVTNDSFISVYGPTGVLMRYNYSDAVAGVRPTITISKDVIYSLTDGGFYLIGQEVCVDGEYFNVISQTDTTVSMLAQYNIELSISPNYQLSAEKTLAFGYDNGWTASPGPQEIDIQSYASEINFYIKEYLISWFSTDETVRLITLTELGNLGCSIQSDYSYTGSESCVDSPHYQWLVNGQSWWTQSANPDDYYAAWTVLASGGLYSEQISNSSAGIRPVVTISKSDLKNLDQTGTLISFNIMGTTYQALQGMTWAEWINSEYNTSGNYIMSNNMITDSAGYPVTYGWVNVGVNEKIVANRDYENYS